MKVMIIEDEPSNERHLRRLLEMVMPEAESIVSADSVRSSIEYLSGNPFGPDLIFADIQLSDGLCFDIFDAVDIQAPTIFTTAYDSYALKAFEYNALSYLLKPVMEQDLRKALAKATILTPMVAIRDLRKQMLDISHGETSYLKRVLLESGEDIFPADVSEICVLESEFRYVNIYLSDGRHGTVGKSLRYFESVLDPRQFIRITRRYIVAPANVKAFRKSEHGKCFAEFPENVGVSVEFPQDKFREIASMFGL